MDVTLDQHDDETMWMQATYNATTSIFDLDLMDPSTAPVLIHPGNTNSTTRALSWIRQPGASFPKHWYQAAIEMHARNYTQGWVIALERYRDDMGHTAWEHLLHCSWFQARRIGENLIARESHNEIRKIANWVPWMNTVISTASKAWERNWQLDDEGHRQNYFLPAHLNAFDLEAFPVDLVAIVDGAGAGLSLLALWDMLDRFPAIFRLKKLLIQEASAVAVAFEKVLAPPSILFPGIDVRWFRSTDEIMPSIPDFLGNSRPTAALYMSTPCYSESRKRAEDGVISTSSVQGAAQPNAGLHVGRSSNFFDQKRLKSLLNACIGANRYLTITETEKTDAVQDLEEMTAMEGQGHVVCSHFAGGSARDRLLFTFPGMPAPPLPWRVELHSIPSGCTFPSSELKIRLLDPIFAAGVIRFYREDRWLPPAFDVLTLKAHSEYTNAGGRASSMWPPRNPLKEYGVLGLMFDRGQVTYFLPRDFIIGTFGLMRDEEERVNSEYPCSERGWCAPRGQPLCINCGLLIERMWQSCDRKLWAGQLMRLVHLWS